MEKWQILYLIVVGAGFGVGWHTTPVIAVVFVWTAVIISETLDYWKEIREFKRRSEEI